MTLNIYIFITIVDVLLLHLNINVYDVIAIFMYVLCIDV